MITRLTFDLDYYGNEIDLKKLEALAQTLNIAAHQEEIDVISVTTETLQEVLTRAEVS